MPISSSGVGEEIGVLLRLVGEVGAVPGDSEHDVRHGVEERSVSRLRAGEGREAPLVLEREACSGDDGVDELRVLEEGLVVDERRDPLAVSLDPGRVPASPSGSGGGRGRPSWSTKISASGSQ